MSRPLVRLSRASIAFPPVEHALTEPNGLLAIGGDLRPERLLNAYAHGIFPWFDDDSPLLWWSPDPRAVLCPDGVRIHRSLRQTLRRARFTVTFDTAFTAVVEGCRAPRDGAAGTWITAAMVDAYAELHRRGIAHSVEAWQAGELVGGLYGVALGGAFFGESMFHRATDASKVALVHLAGQLQAWEFDLIDCQVLNAHTASLGAREVPRREFLARLDQALRKPHRPGPWSLSFHWTPEAARAG